MLSTQAKPIGSDRHLSNDGRGIWKLDVADIRRAHLNDHDVG